ncbi:MAG TPA: LEA type 2 family protein [Thermoanaerobaculia bacterium]|nr:LEA type 2 family protein [Thermoanaerobaculia bacterium]
MKNWSRQLLLAGFVVLIGTTGCSTIPNLVLQNPRYSIRDIRPRVAIALPLSASTIDFDFVLGIDNPNPVSLRLDRVDFNLLINDNSIVDGVSAERIDIPARGVGDVRLRTRVGYNNIRSLFREVSDLVQGNRARYDLRGTVHYNTPIGRMQFPLTIFRSDRDR